jgi:hypothetical protein
MDAMRRSSHRATAALVLVAAFAAPETRSFAQAPVNVYDLADYRLTAQVFEQFVHASGLVAEVTRHDPAFTYAPLFTKDVALDGDAPTVASGLAARLENHAGLAGALQTAKLTPREYSKFAIALVGAHLAHEFVKAGVLQRVPPGAPTNNVEFVKTHEADVIAVLADLGIRN